LRIKNGAIVKIEEKVGWMETELGQLCDIVRGASPRPMGDPRYFTGDIPFIKIGDITKISGKTIFDSEIHVNEEGTRKSRLLKKGSLILSNIGLTHS
jgi:type I restriction enzyme, S subunit